MRPSGLAVPPRPNLQPRSAMALRAACWRGEVPAEALSRAERDELVRELWFARWTDEEIAAHCRMTMYTTARIRTRLGLSARAPQEDVA